MKRRRKSQAVHLRQALTLSAGMVAALFGGLIALQALGFLVLGTGRAGKSVSLLILVVHNLLAVACAWIAFRRARNVTALFWFLYTVCLLTLLIPTAFGTYDTIFERSTLSASTWRVLYCLYGAPILMMLFLPGTDRERTKSEILLDLFQVTIVVGLIFSTFFLLPVQQMSPLDALRRYVGLSNLESLVLLAAVLIRLVFAPVPATRNLLLRVGLFLLVCAVATYLGNRVDLLGHEAASAWFDLGWAVPYVAGGVVALTWRSPSTTPHISAPTGFLSFLGTNLVLVGLLLCINLLVGRWQQAHGQALTAIAVAASLLAFTIRLALTQYHQQREIMERKRVEEKLREYEKVVESSEQMVAVVDRNYRYILTNHAFLNRRGLDRKQVLGRPISEVLHEGDFETVVKPRLDECFQGKTVNYEMKYEYPKLGERDLFLSYFPIEGPRGIDRVACILQDITELKRSEEALRQSRIMLAHILDSVPQSIFWKNRAGNYLGCNALFAKAVGLPSPEAIVGKTDFDLPWPREEAEAYRADDAEVIQHNRAKRHIVEPLQQADGSRLWIDTTKVPLTDRSGVVYGVLGVYEDITERRRAEEQMRLQAAALESVANGIVITDAQGTIQWVNPAFAQLTGYTLKEAVGKNPRILKSGKHEESFYKELWNTIGAGRIWKGEITNRKKDGQLYIEELTIAPVWSTAGEITNFVAIKQDFTERKRVQAELVKAKEIAELASRAKSQFLANMSHELRTPMNGIMGMTELALDTELTSEQRDYLTMVKMSADSLLTVINDILDFSKIEAGKLEFESIEFNLRGSLEATVKVLALRAHEKGLELNCHMQPEVPEMLVGDPSRLRQVITNLIGNAIKFTERGEVTLSVETESEAAGAVVLHFRVSDTGIGIPADRQAAIFDPFTQADGSTTRRYGGTGLGLTISRRLVEMFGGRLWLESATGQGSTFHFTARFGSASSSRSQVLRPAPNLEGVPVLVVDDNYTNRRVLGEFLIGWRMKPTLAKEARTALQQLKQAADTGSPFPLVLLDSRMPGVDGFALVEQIQQDPRLAASSIIMLTSAGQRGDAARCRELGVTAYLTKPIGQAELLDAILKIVGAHVHKTDQPPPLVTRHSLREGRRILRILLAEDNLVNQTVAARLLEKQGHAIEVANNGREALARLSAGSFDLVLMDVQMPEVDGFEATAAIRETEKTKGGHLPIIAMTAHSLKGDQERCIAAGMDGYISKPIQLEQLLTEIERVSSAWTQSR